MCSWPESQFAYLDVRVTSIYLSEKIGGSKEVMGGKELGKLGKGVQTHTVIASLGTVKSLNMPSIQEGGETCGLELIFSLPTSMSAFLRVACFSHPCGLVGIDSNPKELKPDSVSHLSGYRDNMRIM